MIADRLSDYFEGAAAKKLSAVEVEPSKSNQHEFNGVAQLKTLFGEERLKLDADFIYLGASEDDFIEASGGITWYDARERHPTRTEYRLYFTGNHVMTRASEGDILLIAKKRNGGAAIVVLQQDSTFENQLLWLFGIHGSLDLFRQRTISPESDVELGPAARYVLESIGIEIEYEDEGWLDQILERFGESFPSTNEFSIFARETLSEVSALDDPDDAIIRWINREEMLFRTLEKHIVAQRLEEGFEEVEDFISYSLSVQNRRKSRAGYALENHLEHVFISYEIPYSREPVTENRAKPDFIFPGIAYYNDPEFPAENLRMLGVKSTCKDRWRQVLSEAARISEKHLFTLEPGISTYQMAEMDANHLRLVIPHSIHNTYSSAQRPRLLSICDYIGILKSMGYSDSQRTSD